MKDTWHPATVYFCCPGPERLLCSPLRSRIQWEYLLTWNPWRKNTETVRRWVVFLYMSRFCYTKHSINMCPSYDCVINSLNWACCNFEVTHGTLLWYTAGFSPGTSRDAWKHTRAHINIFCHTRHTHTHTRQPLYYPQGAVRGITHTVTHQEGHPVSGVRRRGEREWDLNDCRCLIPTASSFRPQRLTLTSLLKPA